MLFKAHIYAQLPIHKPKCFADIVSTSVQIVRKIGVFKVYT